jgi:hypothetical protein
MCVKRRNDSLGTSVLRRNLNRTQKHLEMEISLTTQNLSVLEKRKGGIGSHVILLMYLMKKYVETWWVNKDESDSSVGFPLLA